MNDSIAFWKKYSTRSADDPLFLEENRIDEAAARRRHETGLLYSVVFGDPFRPTHYVIVGGETSVAQTFFLDDDREVFRTYTFEREPEFEGPLFWRFVEINDRYSDVKSITTYRFETDGTLHIAIQDFTNSELRTTQRSVDVRPNWTPWPEFGHYDELTISDWPSILAQDPPTAKAPN